MILVRQLRLAQWNPNVVVTSLQNWINLAMQQAVGPGVAGDQSFCQAMQTA